MKRTLIAGLIALLLIAPSALAQVGSTGSHPINCDKSAQIAVNSATTTSIVALAASQKIYVCSFVIEIQGIATTAGTGRLVAGTGATCGTGTSNLTPDFIGSTTAGNPTVISLGDGVGTVTRTPAGEGLCYTSTTTTVQKVFVNYAQF